LASTNKKPGISVQPALVNLGNVFNYYLTTDVRLLKCSKVVKHVFCFFQCKYRLFQKEEL